ncbi:hypothetical protein Agabi119p4_8142 [Agaricus bisporus var. burnettii]|uniref:Uncharacterized protein n=1 Tax=Agaricus bisporus var. burnettii TaxID=192524 RepID=A0A8H7EY82_AGABI|nr:hypothetical protein Agabi119p4_8142 [Agaricus bisporus var. burnettii]
MSTGRFSLDAAQLAGIICEAVFYGIYLVTCVFCAQTLLLVGSNQEVRWARLREIRWMMAIIAMIFFLISTWDLAIGILQLFQAFISSEEPVAEYNKVANWINIARILNQGLTILLGDFCLIYRCWIVYERRWLVIAPSLILYFCAIAMMIKVVEIESNPRVVEPITNAIHPWFATMFGVSVVQNISTTGLLVWRIWRIENEVDKYINDPSGSVFNACRPRRLQKVMRVIAESGMIYTTTVFVAFLSSVSGSNATCVVATMALQAAGIAFNVILVRSIENNSELRVGVAGPGRITPIFQHTTGSASVDPEPNQNPRIEMMTAAPCAPV